MKHFFYIIAFLFPLTLFGQRENVLVIADSTVADRWLDLTQNWRYQKGDNMAWANPDFDDSSWSQFSGDNLNMPDGEKAIADRGEIAWFRKRIKANSSLTKTIVLNIRQQGASEIYLDGRLIHQLGKVSSSKDEIIKINPFRQILQLPLEKGKEQVLAVRFVNAQHKFPMYTGTNGIIRISISTLSNANSKDIIKNNRIAFFLQQVKNSHIALGITILMFIIFISFYLFFPDEKINGYFAISILLTILYLSGFIRIIDSPEVSFLITLLNYTCFIFSFIIFLYCLYSIMEQPLDWVYKASIFLGLIAIGCFFLYPVSTVFIGWTFFLWVAIIRISVKSWNKNKVASILFLICIFIEMLFSATFFLAFIGVIQTFILFISPFIFMLIPVTLAIYLGYAFGKRSQDLRLNLERVQKLSKEKETILYSQNETLEKQVKERTSELNHSLENLKSTQAQLIQSEKMASLGELTAGIAHEIQNPLNFVNNFSEVSAELVDEMKEELAAGTEASVQFAVEIADDLKQNLEKITLHGKRADAIVKGMLEHSKRGSGQKELTNLNALADEFLRLSYQSFLAKEPNFKCELKTDFASDLPQVSVIPQDIGKVLLNLFNNAFYACAERLAQSEVEGSRSAVDEKAKSIPQPSEAGEVYKPLVIIKTTAAKSPSGDLGVEISVQDNGPGIPDSIKEKIFQPFFTTKPTGSGTGLGLSLSYDIVKAHGGEIRIESEEGKGSDFQIIIPVFIIPKK
jgi:two-component system NtrC family sensor kinase